MKAVFLDAPGEIAVRETAEPAGRLDDHAALLRVTGASICGSDLPPYRHVMPNFRYGTTPGHEFAGVVVEVGRRVRRVEVGMRAFASDLIACGDCSSCRRGWHYHCPSMALFGTGGTVGTYVPGGQAEFVRVPFADTVLAPIPDGVSDAAAILVGDVLSTAFMGVRRAGLTPEADLAVVGLRGEGS